MKLISYSEQKPTESGDYFVVGKKGSKAVLYYNAEKEEWDKVNVAYNWFSDDNIEWVCETIELPKGIVDIPTWTEEQQDDIRKMMRENSHLLYRQDCNFNWKPINLDDTDILHIEFLKQNNKEAIDLIKQFKNDHDEFEANLVKERYFRINNIIP